MSVIKKRKRISKKNKSAWRKTDINDVEQFLEEQRQEERIGSFKEKKNEELFRVDSTPQKPKPSLLTEKQKRKLNAKKPFRSWEAIENTSKVQDPIVKRNKVIQKKNGRNIEEEVRNPTKPRHFQANKDRERYYQQEEEAEKQKHDKSLKFTKDIWADKDFRDNFPGLKDKKGWISRELSLYHTKNMGKPVIKVHDSIRHRTTKAKNFEAPHPGTSYNPSLKDHQDLINQVVNKEEKIIKEEKHLKRVTTDMFSKVTPEARDRQRLKEMQSGLDADEENNHEKDDGTNSDAVNDPSETQYVSVNPPVENKKKTKQARRKELQQKELQKKHLEKKALKKQIADLHRIKSIKAEVLAEEGVLNELKKHRKKVEFKKKFEPKRLASVKFVEPDADVNMAEDIAGNLRNVKTESSLLIDRFKNFQKRNILPTSVHKSQKKHKVKRFTRNTHKEPGVSYQSLREKKKALNAK